MKIIINKKAEAILKNIKKNLVCSDSTAIIVMSEMLKNEIRKRR